MSSIDASEISCLLGIAQTGRLQVRVEVAK